MVQPIKGGLKVRDNAVEKREAPNTEGRAAFSIDDSCAYTGVSRATLYRLLGEGVLPSLHVGRRRLVLRKHLDAFLRQRLEAEGHGA
jgi:excisionase family DNA binding protein